MEHLQSGLGQPLLPLLGNLGGTDLVRCPGLVLVLIVIEPLFGDDLNGGKGLPLQDAHLDLPALYILLHHTAAAQLQALFQGTFQLLLGTGDGHADGRAVVHGLDHAGHLQTLHQAGDVRCGVVHQLPAGGLHPQRGHDALGQVLIHGDGGAQVVGPGIGDAHEVQSGLHPAVLAAGPVEGQEHHVRLSAQLQHPRSKLAGAPVSARGLHLLQVGGHPAHPGQLLVQRCVKQGLHRGVGAQEHIHKGHLVPPLAQGGAHLAAAGQRDIPLRAQSARQYHNLHDHSPLSVESLHGTFGPYKAFTLLFIGMTPRPRLSRGYPH